MEEELINKEEELERVKKELLWISGFSNNILKAIETGTEKNISNLLTNEMIQQIDFFMDFYQKKLATIDNKKNQLEKDKKSFISLKINLY